MQLHGSQKPQQPRGDEFSADILLSIRRPCRRAVESFPQIARAYLEGAGLQPAPHSRAARVRLLLCLHTRLN